MIELDNTESSKSGSSNNITPVNNNPKATLNQNNKGAVKLTYYFDPLCGWCFGFSSVILKLQEEFADKIEIEVVSGGLFLGNHAGNINTVAPHIKAGAYKSVEERTGVKFGDQFLAHVFDKGQLILDSLPPTIALCIVQEKMKAKALKFASLLLSAVYKDGIDPTDIESYAKIVHMIGFDFEEFKEKMKLPFYKDLAFNQFEQFAISNHSAMPAVTITIKEKEERLSHGYMDYPTLENNLKHYLALIR